MAKQAKNYTEEEMKQGWRKLMMSNDLWMGKICAEISVQDAPLVVEAIKFYTGIEPQVHRVPSGRVKVMCNGYRHGPWKEKEPERKPF